MSYILVFLIGMLMGTIFLISLVKPKQPILYKVQIGYWNVDVEGFNGIWYTDKRTCRFEIYKHDNDLYTLKSLGYDPYNHTLYAEMIEYVNKLNDSVSPITNYITPPKKY